MAPSIESFLIFVYVIFVGAGIILVLNAIKSWLLKDTKAGSVKFWIGIVLILSGMLIGYVFKLIK